eukprot:GHRR01025544.1.p1 GENE.GHRR01025544.1~~GHRR01025544.1.p1  ORF type:complete len:117 (+),score=6.37 GHRR01025544.1:215-565(+)
MPLLLYCPCKCSHDITQSSDLGNWRHLHCNVRHMQPIRQRPADAAFDGQVVVEAAAVVIDAVAARYVAEDKVQLAGILGYREAHLHPSQVDKYSKLDMHQRHEEKLRSSPRARTAN